MKATFFERERHVRARAALERDIAATANSETRRAEHLARSAALLASLSSAPDNYVICHDDQ